MKRAEEAEERAEASKRLIAVANEHAEANRRLLVIVEADECAKAERQFLVDTNERAEVECHSSGQIGRSSVTGWSIFASSRIRQTFASFMRPYRKTYSAKSILGASFAMDPPLAQNQATSAQWCLLPSLTPASTAFVDPTQINKEDVSIGDLLWVWLEEEAFDGPCTDYESGEEGMSEAFLHFLYLASLFLTHKSLSTTQPTSFHTTNL
ncbi:hypothetical protein M378DRAFT_16902 [Amanita muscaria Koide BX008]|uniref:Uncharacterized protein n=1 Tax=Amanita muscaria (strain Koide BX008) TaxID=946122 RepID=A0A0C2WJ10_AMAMK|nr:hypothetical protein M378DRAFT_16902 [Amanita muscaria Koide BX008]